MRIFREVILPKTCYVSEVAYWLALGRVPEFFANEDGFDSRNDSDAAFSGETAAWFRTDFSEMEFGAMGIDIDIDRYEEAIARAGDATAAQYIDREKTRWDEIFPSLTADDSTTEDDFVSRDAMRFILEDSRKIAANDVQWARDIEDECASVVDVAKAEVFSALASGKLQAFGWVKHENPEPHDEQGRFVDIPAKAWSLKFNWNDISLDWKGTEYKIVQVHMEDALKAFPQPSCSPEAIQVNSYAETIIVHEHDGEQPAKVRKPSPGRNPKAGLPIKTVVQNMFGDRVNEGKQEALISEISEFVAKAYREKIGRSTVQEWISPFRKRLDTSAGN